MKIGIIGSTGMVGSALLTLLKQDDLEIVESSSRDLNEIEINTCEIVFICVPSPMSGDGSCDTSIVESTVKWLKVPLIVIKSTIPPGTTDYLIKKYKKSIVFNPEFLREKTNIKDMLEVDRTVLGGDIKLTQQVVDVYKKVYDSEMIYVQTTSVLAELTKYTINCYLATKVTFFNEIASICDVLGINYDQLREIVLLDRRITKSHTLVNKGFGGACLPKDLNGLISHAQSKGYEPELLKEVWASNLRFR